MINVVDASKRRRQVLSHLTDTAIIKLLMSVLQLPLMEVLR